MSNKLDTFLSTHTPHWYRTPTTQTAFLGAVFFWVFGAYTTIQFYSSSTYGQDLAANCVSAVYLTFTLTCLVAPGVTNRWGCRRSMCLGVLGYALLVFTSLIYFWSDGVFWARRLVVMGGAILGIGAALLWTAQGRLILEYASRAKELEKEISSVEEKNEGLECYEDNAPGGLGSKETKSQTGTLMGLFWAIFQCSSIVGGTISFLYYNKKPEGSTSLYFLFLGFILLGALFTQILLPPSMLEGNYQKDVELVNEETSLKSKFGGMLSIAESSKFGSMLSLSELSMAETKPTFDDLETSEELIYHSWKQEMLASVDIFLTRRMSCLFFLFFYTGFNQPYQQATFGNRFFTRRTIGAELVIFHLMEITGAIVCGRFLDHETPEKPKSKYTESTSRRKRALICLLAFFFINSSGNFLAFMKEYEANQERDGNATIASDISSIHVIPPSLAFACWGFADAQIQVYCYWLMGGLYKSGSDHSRVVGFYKCVQSFGTSIGFYLIPTSRLGEMSQLVISSMVFCVGTGLAFFQLP